MMDLQELNAINRVATQRAASRHVEPVLWTGDRTGFHLPLVGDRTPRGWRMTARDDLFCDTSGWGREHELALTTDQMFDAFKIGMGYGVISSGQFQSYVREFRKVT
jgi:hypothetical protein